MASPVDGGSTTRAAESTVPPPVEGFARGPVLGIAFVVGVLLVAVSERYGYLSDELYFLAAGKHHLDWGYMDQQPLVPLLARGIDAAFPGSLIAFRLPAMLATVLGTVVTALIAREFGGDRRAQVLAAAAYPLAPWLLLSGHWLAAATFEPLQWSVLVLLLVRWARLRTRGLEPDRLLLAAGVVVAVSVQNKFQIAVLCAAALLGAGMVGPRALLRRPMLWGAAALALAAAAPTLFWQAQHGWPALDMGTVVDAESDRLLFLPTALLYAGAPVGAVLVCAGWWYLLRSPHLRPYRFLGWAAPLVVLFYLVVSGRPNYLAGLYGLLFAAAVVGFRARQRSTGRSRAPQKLWAAYLLSALLPFALLPIYPLSVLARHPEIPSYGRLYETGWQDLARTVADAYHSLPADLRQRTTVVGQTYHLAGALDVHGPELGLPRAHSPHRGYWFFGPPPDEADAVLYVGNDGALAPYFHRERQLSTVTSPLENLARGNAVTLYEQPVAPWSRLWEQLRTI